MIAALLLAACTSSPRAPYPLHPASRSASGGPVAIDGAVAHPGTVPYTPGLSLRAVLQLVGGATEPQATLFVRRAGVMFRVDLYKLLAGTTPDPELGPGDHVTVEPRLE